MGISEIIALIASNLPSIIQGGTALWDFITQIRTTAQQTGEWTPEAEAAYQAQLTAANNAPESKTDAEAGQS